MVIENKLFFATKKKKGHEGFRFNKKPCKSVLIRIKKNRLLRFARNDKNIRVIREIRDLKINKFSQGIEAFFNVTPCCFSQAFE